MSMCVRVCLCAPAAVLSVIDEVDDQPVPGGIFKTIQFLLGVNGWSKITVANQSVTWEHVTGEKKWMSFRWDSESFMSSQAAQTDRPAPLSRRHQTTQASVTTYDGDTVTQRGSIKDASIHPSSSSSIRHVTLTMMQQFISLHIQTVGMPRGQHHLARFSPTFAHSICISLQLTVLHARNEVKQSENLLLGKCSPRRHHQAPREVAGAVVDHRVAARVGCRVKMDSGVHESSTTFPDSHVTTWRWKSMRVKCRLNYLCAKCFAVSSPLGPQ